MRAYAERVRLLVVAKAPHPGRAKTRLAATVGDAVAADLAAAALLDTLRACADAVGADRCVLALADDLAGCAREPDLRHALVGWTVVPQRGAGFAERLAAAHVDAGPGPVVQVGMDTPQLTPALLLEVAAGLDEHDAVLGAAPDGGWWVLALRDPAAAAALRGVRMSTESTGRDTRRALEAGGSSVAEGPSLTDVDTAADADLVVGGCAAGEFGRAWRAVPR
ncbi:TIGR04282 family arsenosugar biosynthesis glycosyltransferase [Nocardioides aestuarii]|uniref:DUF2064 domain-containing protein n=1 Tax=Nocardioides aestuarii TaxID=252231 RepID=A0ABW4TQN0_9ACTN